MNRPGHSRLMMTALAIALASIPRSVLDNMRLVSPQPRRRPLRPDPPAPKPVLRIEAPPREPDPPNDRQLAAQAKRDRKNARRAAQSSEH